MKKFASLVLLFLISISLFAQDRITGKNFATRSDVMARHGMVCTSQPLATQIGIDILKKGGSAVDAAIAANAALGLMEPTGSGIGGDLFAIVWDAKTKKLYGLNASGRSPKALTLAIFKEKGLKEIPPFGPLPVTVPGCVDGWFSLHDRFGKLPMKDILEPTIQYAEEGFPVTDVIGYYFGRSVEYFSKKFPNVKETYMSDGEPPYKGKVFRNPMLANTYRKIAKGGRDAFYKGRIAHVIADFIQEQGGYLSYEDFAAHHSEWVEPVSVNYRGYDVWELPPNGQGIAALQMLQILKGYDIASMGFGSADHIHYFTEAKKLAFEDRAKYYADMDFAKVPVQTLISEKYAAERRKLIRPDRAGEYSAGEISQGETVYLTAADDEGNMVSLIQSNYRGMGSGMVPPGLGFMLQDRGQLFNLEEGHSNTYEPGKRPFHTIIPAFVTKDGQPFMSFGVMGGDFQPQGHVQILMNLIDFGMGLQEAGDAPRISHDGSTSPTGTPADGTGRISLESGFGYEAIRTLMQRGHRVGYENGIYGGYQAIMYDAKNDVYYGASESRKDGEAIGY
ncbi:gamma-glutamyltransferase [Prolixibacter denitrificans]|uniref:Glutathione hydrolase proenzyme n=1 Tax=Prolixibacter denitrificans TaxID=1541063 RepID=A0A2P8CAC0_9BACT|nr:gamma-glutamyltransferase [Prolixibacter denitrificans]PSK81909.1 gamma-glutamyltranspeptidase/glutathione hydrolase [Prolixibacter denitrificans]GET22508.1 gamma-glutamyltransferase [Prolixibacter denitrificans]